MLLNNRDGFVMWFTGLSGSGKSTLARSTFNELKKREIPVEWLDGDDFRKKFNFDLSFSAQDRIINIQRAVYIIKMLNKNGINVIGSFITPYEEQRIILRNNFIKYLEIFLDVSIDVCKKRDVKGIYEKVREGGLKNFTGIDDPYEKPRRAEICLKTDNVDESDCLKKILDYLIKNKLIPPVTPRESVIPKGPVLKQ